MTVSEFRAKCLGVLDRVAANRWSVLLTRRGKPFAKLVPIIDDVPEENPLKGSIVHQGDIVNPTGEQWNTDRE